MKEKLVRVTPYFGEEALNNIATKRVLIIGLGGVGGLVCETLIRNGVCHFGICDGDKVELSNFNRQIIATNSSLGKNKVEAMKNRLIDIESNIEVDEYPFFINQDTVDKIDFSQYDLILDCIDDVKGKVLIIEKAKELHLPFISSMGSGNKTDPNGFRIANINQTSYCPLAKKVRLELRKKGINDALVCYSPEIPLKNSDGVIASPMFVVGSASFLIAKKALELLTVSK